MPVAFTFRLPPALQVQRTMYAGNCGSGKSKSFRRPWLILALLAEKPAIGCP